MSIIHITACPLAPLSSCFPTKALQLNASSICPSTYLGRTFPKQISLKLTPTTSGTRFPKISLSSTLTASRKRFTKISLKSIPTISKNQKTAIVCSLGEGKSQSENQVSPWKVLEKAVGNLKKDPSVEDLLRQQIQKQEYYDGGDGGKKPPGGGGGGGGGGFGSGGGEDEGLSGVWDEFGQVILATMGLIFLYIYILEGEEINVLVKDFLKFIFKRQTSIRLKRLMEQCSRFFQSMRDKGEYEDPYWLERAIINTPTCYDHPVKYKWLIKVLDSIESNSDANSDEE